MKRTFTKRVNNILAAVLTITALMAGQTAMAETVTYTLSGDTELNGNANLDITASGSATGTYRTSWAYATATSVSVSLPGSISLSFGTDNTSKGMAVMDGLVIEATSDNGGYITLSHASKYIYHVTLKYSNGNTIHEEWNMTKSYTYRFKEIKVQTIEVEYATTIPITDAAISGLSDQYIVSNAPITPVPTVTWHGTKLTRGTHYTLGYQNNDAAGTATVTATGKGIFSSSTSTNANYTLVWATYTVRFNKNNASAKGTMSNQAFYYTEQKALTANAFTRTGYHFDRWTTEADGTGDSYTDEQSISNLTAENGTTIDLYAQWTAPYIDADGNEQTCSNYNIITSSTGSTVQLGTDGKESWYVVDNNVSITRNGSDALKFYGAVHLILMDGATLTVEGRLPISAYGSLTIYGQSHGTGSLVANGTGIAIKVSESTTAVANNGSLTINGGNINATSSNSNDIDVENAIIINGGSVTASSSNMYGNGITSTNGGITINGGTVNATGGSRGDGIRASSTLTLGWRNTTDRIYASSYYSQSDNILVKSGQAFTDGTNIYCGTLTYDQYNALAGKTLQPVDALVLADNADNTSIINSHNGETTNVMLYGRTLYKDGAWNTLCLPFDLNVLNDIINNDDSPLHGTTIMWLDTDGWYSANGNLHTQHIDDTDGCHRSGQVENGTLYLYFSEVMTGNNGHFTSIFAGTPFLVKWDGDGTNNIVNPVFTGVTVSNATDGMNSTTVEGSEDGAHEGNVTFKATYSPVPLTAGDQSILFMGGNNTLYYPGTGMTMGAFRAYFQLNLDGSSNIKEFRLNFGEDEATSLNEELRIKNEFATAKGWYTLDGRKLDNSKFKTQNSKLPSGIYIHNGRKVMVK